MSKFSNEVCDEIQRIVIRKDITHFEKCDKIHILLDGGFFGKELIEQFPSEYRIIKNIFKQKKYHNDHVLALRFLDKFIKTGKLADATDNDLKNILGKDCTNLVKEVIDAINEHNKKDKQEFINQATRKFGDVYDYTQVIYYGDETEVKIYCKKCETWFYQKPLRHLQTQNPCFKCILYENGGKANERTRHWSKIIKGLYIGDVHSALDRNFITSRRFAGVIDLTNSSHGLRFDKSVKVYRIALDDNQHSIIRGYFKRTYDFIEQILDKHKSVLVFCRAGVSRSSTICIYYLMKKFNLTYEDALQYMKSCRSQIQPNIGFEKQLITAEKSIFNSNLPEDDKEENEKNE